MANYVGDLQLASSQVGKDTMFDDENAVVNETPRMHEEAALGVSLQAAHTHPFCIFFYNNFNSFLESPRDGVPKLSMCFCYFS